MPYEILEKYTSLTVKSSLLFFGLLSDYLIDSNLYTVISVYNMNVCLFFATLSPENQDLIATYTLEKTQVLNFLPG